MAELAHPHKAGAVENGTWHNYAQNSYCTPKHIYYPSNTQEVVDIVKKVKEQKGTLRVFGDSHSYNPLVPTNWYLLSTKNLNRIISTVDEIKATGKMWVEPGVTVDQTLKMYGASGHVLPMNVDVPPITIGGAVSVGANGFSKHHQTYSDFTEAVEIVDGNGVVRHLTREKNADEMKAVSCSLGLCGIMTKIQLNLHPMFLVEVINKKMLMTEMLSKLEKYITKFDYWQVFWFPFNDQVQVQTSQVVTGVPPTPGEKIRTFWKNFTGFAESFATKLLAPMLAHEGSLTPIWTKGAFGSLPQNDYVMYQNDNVMLSNWIDKFAASENTSVSFPVDLTPEGYATIRKSWDIATKLVGDYAAQGKYPANLEMNFRVFKTSSQLLLSSSETTGALTCNIQITSFKNAHWNDFAKDLFTKWMHELPGSRPHWGKQFQNVPESYPLIRQRLGNHVNTFVKVVNSFDPDHIFVNDFLANVFQLSHNPGPKD